MTLTLLSYLYILFFNYNIVAISDTLIMNQHKAIADHVSFCIFPFTITAFAILKITNAMCTISKIIALPPKIFARNSAFLGTSYYVILCLKLHKTENMCDYRYSPTISKYISSIFFRYIFDIFFWHTL